ncbi:hypothetical protein [Phytoactinopolyspora halotolerans]|uniref:Uncharacterized protein n=1 Tax=Phytoactinopolyspora halotolerans TaxID=1981512 RepID=A0A6L9SE09_9ACTN|nr:hypothetical protein [Phytoactinopolyspora halotolerans]NEE02290.1 hypothetical protein [Phytoactinopolyspora halotolerans]
MPVWVRGTMQGKTRGALAAVVVALVAASSVAAANAGQPNAGRTPADAGISRGDG